ncbi:branched-chain amino acid ABC transporter permease [Salsipaludibacter albus]|uniref:branched-chain amino acid ABC transporter permease n=1 Tax=Salsipaludibacter albus TaxID=2849650 RepID=UPI001EE46F21|nr:branched-chain amino acid ABC transporter permease [Salsipaludibacter albus]
MLGHVLNGLSFGGLLFLLASGLTLTFGMMRTVNLAHGAFYALGGYLALAVIRASGSYLLGLVVAVAVVAVVGVVLERVVLQRVAGRELPQIMITVGIAYVIGDVVLAVWGGRPQTLPRPPGLDGVLNLGSLTFPWFRLGLLVLAVVVYLVLQRSLADTLVGARIRAAVDDDETARAVGIDVGMLFAVTFAAGSGLAAFAGVWGGAFTGLRPGTEWDILLLALIVVVVGGLGSIRGAFVAALLVGLLDEFGKWLFPSFALFTLYAPVAVLLALRPRGLFGREERVA